METIIIAVNVILAVILIILVLLQRSEGEHSVLAYPRQFCFNKNSWKFLTKSTAIIATLFIISSISLVVLSRGDLEEKKSVIERLEQEKDSDLPKIPDSQK